MVVTVSRVIGGRGCYLSIKMNLGEGRIVHGDGGGHDNGRHGCIRCSRRARRGSRRMRGDYDKKNTCRLGQTTSKDDDTTRTTARTTLDASRAGREVVVTR